MYSLEWKVKIKQLLFGVYSFNYTYCMISYDVLKINDNA